MLITKRIKRMDSVLEQFGGAGNVYVVFPNVQTKVERLRELGFSNPFTLGELLLPAASFGRAAKRNANGFEIVHRDQPKEIRYHQIQWSWTEFHGKDTVERTEIRDRPYYRYPRTNIPPYSIELGMHTNVNEDFVVAAGPFDLTQPFAALQNTIHMFVDLFGGCTLVRELGAAVPIVERKLNWEILPQGEWPWERVRDAVQRVINRAKPVEQPVLQARFDEIAAFRPSFTATGRGGFSRYIVHGWDAQQIYLLESMEVNNATYVLRDNWEAVSAMTKAQILHADAHDARLIHRQQWFSDLRNLMDNNGIGRMNDA